MDVESGCVLVVPEPLQVGRHRPGARRADYQVAGVLEQQFLQVRINAPLLVRSQADISGPFQNVRRAGTDIEGAALEEQLEISQENLL